MIEDLNNFGFLFCLVYGTLSLTVFSLFFIFGSRKFSATAIPYAILSEQLVVFKINMIIKNY
jgi:hypothetical protein